MVNNNFFQGKFDCIKYPISTEKSTKILSEKNQHATFLVDKKANKIMIKNAIEFLFNVKVIKVNTSLLHPTRKKRSKNNYYTTYKKAIIKLAHGNKIDLF
jgi:large subunit ribosomal protein L23